MQALLDLHEARRSEGVPTLTLLVGEPGPITDLFERRARDRLKSIAHCDSSSLERMFEIWCAKTASLRDFQQVLCGRVASACAFSREEIEEKLQNASIPDQRRLIDLAVDGGLDPVTAQLTQLWFERSLSASLKRPEAFAAAVVASVKAEVGEEAGLAPIAAPLGSIVGWDRVPFLLVGSRASEFGDALARAVDSAASLCVAAPAFPVALLVDRLDFERFRSNAPETRSKAMAIEGAIHFQSPVGRAIEPPSAPIPTDTLKIAMGTRLLRRLEASRLAPIAEALAQVQGLVHEDASEPCEESSDRCASAVERFLYEVLQAFPPTRNVLSLNERVALANHASSTIELDLFSRRHGLVIEIDGYYHFLNKDAYRRDRRKDVTLQRNGCLVYRVLAEDVVDRLENVLETIESLVDERAQKH